MEITNISSNQINDLNIQNNSPQSDSKITLNNTQKVSDSFSNSYFVSPEISPKRSDLSNNLSQYISEIASSQIQLSSLNNSNDILDNIIQTSIISIENPKTLTPEVEQSLNELMNKYQNESSQNISSQNNTTTSTSYFDGMVGAKPMKLQDMVETSNQLKQNTKNDIKIVEDKIETIKTTALNTIGEEISKNENLHPNKQIDFGKMTSDFSASNINSLVGSVAITQANAIPIQSQRLLS